MLLFFTTCMQTAEPWAKFQFAAFDPQWLVKSDVICCAACIMQKTEPLESQISVLGLQSATVRSTNGEPGSVPIVAALEDLLISCWSKIK